MLVYMLDMSHNRTSNKYYVACQGSDMWYDFSKHNGENGFVLGN